MLRRLLVGALAAAALVVVAPATNAWAGGGGSWVTCTQGQPGCEVGARNTRTIPAKQSGTGGNSSSKTSCTDWMGQPAPCYMKEFGWMGSDGCYYKQVATPDAATQAAFGGAGTGAGGWFDFVCGGPGTGGGLAWLAFNSPNAPPAPVVLAWRAVSRLNLPSPVIRVNPTGQQLVHLPTWLWLGANSWRARSASAQVPGVAVTATATPQQVVWSMGDGTTVTCTGPGTAWRDGTAPAKPSPTCGHTYQQPSAGQPDQAFRVTATVTWSIGWTGGGQAGALPAMQTTATTALQVAESQAVVTG